MYETTMYETTMYETTMSETIMYETTMYETIDINLIRFAGNKDLHEQQDHMVNADNDILV